MSETPRSISVRMVVGLGFTAFGLVLLAEALGWVDDDQLVVFWPILIIFAGITLLGRAREGGAWFPGAVLVLVGASLLAERLGYLPGGFERVWPLILVLLGIAIMTRGLGRRSTDSETSEAATVSKFVVLCSSRPRISAPDFRGGDITAFMGGADLDLTHADIAEQDAVLDVLVLMGGLEVRVPRHWTVDAQVTPFMGGLEDSTDRSESDPAKRLVIKGFVMMGGVEIKN